MEPLQLKTYLDRICYEGATTPDLDTLFSLHFSHTTHVPFENLDIQLGLPIYLDLDSLHHKIVENRRGGYCFEQNTLFQHVLQSIGFHVLPCEARVRFGTTAITPRTHMVLLVRMNDMEYLCDVGFGGDGLLYPLPLDGQSHRQFLWNYRVADEGDQKVLQAERSGGWFDYYAFLPEERPAIDFEVSNWFTCTHPRSRFVTTLTVQLSTGEARYILRNRNFIMDRGGSEETAKIQSPEELLELLGNRFGLTFPPGTRFKNPAFNGSNNS